MLIMTFQILFEKLLLQLFEGLVVLDLEWLDYLYCWMWSK